jgi:hypothetical protein
MITVKEQHDHSIVAAIPSNARDDEHCTVAYLTEGGSVAGTTIERYIQTISRWVMPFFSRVTEHDTFGQGNELVRVARLDLTPFYTVRSMMQSFDKGDWIYKPHITEVGGTLRGVGEFIRFDRLGLWFNDEMINWRLGTGERCA